jgi:hypothetical protein
MSITKSAFAFLIILCLSAAINGHPLSDLAAQMKPGDWRELNTSGLTSGFLETTGGDPCCKSILQYTDKAAWDPKSEQFFFVGSPHMNPFKFIIYSAQTNSWRSEGLPLTCMTTTDLNLICGAHGYEQNTIDPINGDFYYKVRSRNIYRYNLQYQRWLPIRPMPENVVPYPGHANAIEFFPDIGKLAFSTGAGGSGLFLYDTATTQWSRVMAYMQVGFLHNVCSYNPVHKCLVYGGGNDNMNFFRLDADETVTQIASSPTNIRVEGDLFTVDPVSGKHLAFTGANSFYEYDVPADKWTQVNASVPISSGDRITLVVATPISNYGVIMFLRHTNPPKVYLYKHAEQTRIESTGPGKRPERIELKGVPNPFYRKTGIHYKLPNTARASIKIYAMDGRLVRTLLENHEKTPGQYHIAWDGLDNSNRPVSQELFLCVLKTGKTEKVLKLFMY